MKLVIQRVRRAQVSVDSKVIGSIGPGLLILLGIHRDDTPQQADFLAEKCAELRIFSDENAKMNVSVRDIEGQALVVSQFTLLGDCSKGRRPNFLQAASPDEGRHLYEYFVEKLRSLIPVVHTGEFGAMMDVELVNDGPVTLILEK